MKVNGMMLIANIMPRASRVIAAECNAPIKHKGEAMLLQDLIGTLSSASGLALLS